MNQKQHQSLYRYSSALLVFVLIRHAINVINLQRFGTRITARYTLSAISVDHFFALLVVALAHISGAILFLPSAHSCLSTDRTPTSFAEFIGVIFMSFGASAHPWHFNNCTSEGQDIKVKKKKKKKDDDPWTDPVPFDGELKTITDFEEKGFKVGVL